MRRRLRVLVAVTTSLVLVSFLVPLAVLVQTVAADRAINAATRQAEGLAPLVGAVDTQTLAVTLGQLAREDAENFRLTVFLPEGTVLGVPAPVSRAVELAATGRSFTAVHDGGLEVLVAAQGGPRGTAVIRAFVSTEQLRAGVTRTWLILGLLGAGLLALSILVADRLARSIVLPIEGLVHVTHRLAEGDLSVRASSDGPVEVREVAGGLNLLAGRISELLTAAREDVADLSHQLRTPLTALRLGVEAIPDSEDQARLAAAVSALENTVDRVIREARRPIREGAGGGCDAAAVIAERLGFWSALAEDENRTVTTDLPVSPVLVRTTAADLAVAVDALLGNVFAHTPEGTAFAVRLRARPDGGAILTVDDDGPGLSDADGVLVRGASAGGSTGLGLDIVRRTAAAADGSVQMGRAPGGGARVTVRMAEPPHLHAARRVGTD